jgi:PASTA domain
MNRLRRMGGVLVAVLACWLCAGAGAALAQVGSVAPATIQTALTAYNNGTATPAETELVQAVTDFLEINNGVSSSQLSFESIYDVATGTTNPFSADPFLLDMQNFDAAVPASGSIASEVGGELATVGEDLGMDAPEEAAMGLVCAESVVCAGGLAIAGGVVLALGTQVFGIGSGGSDSSSSPYTAGSVAPGTSNAVKLWEPVYDCNAGYGWIPDELDTPPNDPYTAGNDHGFAPAYPAPGSGTGGLDGGSGWNNGQGLSGDNDGIPVPCGTGIDPGNGYWSLWVDAVPVTGGSMSGNEPNGWINAGFSNETGVGEGVSAGGYCYGTMNAWPGVGPGVGSSATNSLLEGVPEHGWLSEFWADVTNGTCTSGVSAPAGGGASIERRTGENSTMPRTGTVGTCPSGDKCITGTVEPSSNWCTTGGTLETCIASTLGEPAYSGLAALLNTGVEANNPTTGAPYAPEGAISVPNCAGDTVTACETALSAAGFSGYSVTTATDSGAVVTIPAGDVIYTTPAEGTSVDTSTQIAIEINPTPLPLEIPAPSANEVYTQYETTLATDGFTNVQDAPVSDVNESTTVGPNVVLTVSPAPGTEVAPGTDINIDSNPADAPVVGAAPVPGASCGLTAPSSSVNFGPITGLNFGSVFPFSVIPWLEGLAGSAPGAQAPDLSFNVFGTSIDATQPLGSTFDPVFGAIRSVIEVLLWLSVAWVMYRRITGSF